MAIPGTLDPSNQEGTFDLSSSTARVIRVTSFLSCRDLDESAAKKIGIMKKTRKISTPRDGFIYNYWNDLVGPDVNGDGIVDIPYTIDGAGNNVDSFPMTTSVANEPLPHPLQSEIIIDGNLDFQAQALSRGWLGTGTQNDPIIISNLLLVRASTGNPEACASRGE